MLKTSFEDAQKSMESGDSAGENVAVNLEPVESGFAASVNRHQTHPSEMRVQDQQTSVEPFDHNRPKAEFKGELLSNVQNCDFFQLVISTVRYYHCINFISTM